MTLFKALSQECVAVKVSLADKASALSQIVRLAKASAVLAGVPEADILDGLRHRESLGSTGFGGGIAIPHCRLEAVPEFVVGLLTVPGGVDFDAMDGQKVRLIVFIVGPKRASNEHIRLLSAISQALSIPGAVDELVAAPSEEALRESFLRHVRDELRPVEEAGRDLFQVICRSEEVFQGICQVFGGIDSSGVVVLNAESASVYLARVPLFADFWSDSPAKSNRVIVAMVSKRITNETIRRIERVTGPLKDRSDVLVIVQDVFYSAGALDK